MAVEKFIPISSEQAPVDERLAAFSSPCENKEPYALMVLGDSMLPEFAEGDVIVIEPSTTAGDGAYVIAYHNDEYIFRQWVMQDGKCFLKPLNGRYPTVEVSGMEVVKGVIRQKKSPGGGRKSIKSYA